MSRLKPASCIALLLVLAFPVWAAPTARLDRNQVTLGETLRLTLGTDPQNGGGEPDLTPLYKDFDVRGTSQSTQVQIINGRRSVNASWIIELEPKHTGLIRIPALRGAGGKTQPLLLRVVDAPSVSGNPRGDVFMDVSVAPNPVYVGQQMTVRIQLWRAIDMVQATLDALDVDGAQVSQLGDDVGYTARKGNTRFQVVERRYAVVPDNSGVLKIPQLTFAGTTGAPLAGSVFGMQRFFSTGGRRVRAVSKAVNVNVMPAPPGPNAGSWLPARSLDFVDNWGAKTPRFQVGQPFTRNITQHATGVLADQLPEIQSPDVLGLRQYPDQPDLSNGVNGQWLDARRTDHIAYVPSRPGTFTLPELTVSWWDVTRKVQREAVIPARTIKVLPAATAEATAPAPSPPPQVTTAASPVKPRPAVAREMISTPAPTMWRNLALGIAALWLATLLLWWHKRGPRPAKTEKHPRKALGRKIFLAACREQDVNAATHSILEWAKTDVGCSAKSIPAVAEFLGPSDFSTALLALDGVCFGDAAAVDWDTLIRDCPKTLDSEKSAGTDAEPLAPLYPE